MKIATRLIAIGLIMAGGVAVAQQTATNPAVVARQDDMRTLGASSKVLGDMAGGKAAFDAAKAKAALEAIVAGADKIPALFKPQEMDPAMKAKPDVWSDWDTFARNAGELKTTAAGIDVSTLEGVQAGMKAIGGACSNCHRAFRM